ncbi:MAG: hypothetical protein VKO39_07100 [Cyanobacteriota bacterium]|nr:hypothetical protein [Cyanobacteriota bacterium]
MANRSSLNVKNLEALGAARLAALLLAHTEGNAAARRALRLELAQQEGPLEMARAVRKRLATIARSSSWLDPVRETQLVGELDRQRQAIAGPIAAHDADLAMALLWRLLELSDAFLDRCEDEKGEGLALFQRATADLGQVARQADRPKEALVEEVVAALPRNGYGQFDRLIEHLKEALQPEGLRLLRERLAAQRPARTEVAVPWFATDGEDWPLRIASGEGEGAVDAAVGATALQGWAAEPRGLASERDSDDLDVNNADPDWLREVVRDAMLAIADALDDAEAYLAEYRDHQPEALTNPSIAAAVASRLCGAGRGDEALALLADADLSWGVDRAALEAYVDARLLTLEALGRDEEAQALRWEHGLRGLSMPHLREHLKHLPAFEDAEAEERALDLVLQHPSFERAVVFLHQWPDRRRTARLILERPEELDGEAPEVLVPLAEALEAAEPLAATLCLRALIECGLESARASRHRAAAHQLTACARLAKAITDWRTIPDHPTYLGGLLRAYSFRTTVWRLLPPTERAALRELPGLPLSMRELLE